MTNNWFLFLAISLAPMPIAQPAYSQDNPNAIIEMLRRIEGRLDGMSKRIDSLEKRIPAAATKNVPAANSPANAATETGLPPGMKAIPGWSVNVIPFVEGNPNPDPLFRFHAEKLPLRFNAHLATRQIDNWVKYRGEAKLNAFEAGRYVFQIDLMAANDWVSECVPILNVGKDRVIAPPNGSYRVDAKGIVTASGGIDLQPGNYDITFDIGCVSMGTYGSTGLLGLSGPKNNIQEPWLRSGFSILIRAPSDDNARPFTSKELFHLVRTKQDF